MGSPRWFLISAAALFLLSGASSLVYEVTWVKILTVQFGSSAWSIATVIALLTAVPPETAVALGSLRRRGYAVSAILVAYDPHEFAELSKPLAAQRIEVRQLSDEASIPTLCTRSVLR